MRVATGLSRVSGMFRCNPTGTIASHTLRKESAPREYSISAEIKELLEMAANYNPRDHIVRY